MRKRKSIVILMLTVLLTCWVIPAFAANDGKQANKPTIKIGLTKQKSSKNNQSNTLPDENTFQDVAENDGFVLKADSKTGHFIVINKETNAVLRSFPNPDGWEQKGTSSAWKAHLRSPIMFSYVEMNVRKDMVKESNLISQNGDVNFKKIENGFQITYDLPKVGFVIPIQVRLDKDFVETTVLSEDIVDVKQKGKNTKDPMARLVSLRLFPFLGAETSEKENGFILLPDGSGVLVDFKKNRSSTSNLYSERVYGEDMAFAANSNLSSSLPIRMPVFGIVAGDQATLGVIHKGEAYSSIVSAPSQSMSQYNWATGEHLFRFKVFQPTNKKQTEGFFTYTEDLQRTKRVIRYYMMTKENPDYVDLAERYREYLIKEHGFNRKNSDKKNIDLQLNILGGGTKNGFIRDSFLPLTTTDEATQIVKELSSLGINDMSITYHGWQNGGYGKYGGHFPVDGDLGGNRGMKSFVDFAHSKGMSVYLDASSYTFNNTGKDGFRQSRDGLRDLGSSIIKFKRSGIETTFVSPRFMKDVILKDLEKVKELGVDGYLYGSGIGAMLATDFNDRHFASRHEAKEIQQDIFEKTKEVLGDVRVTSGNLYAINNSSHIDQMDHDYSFGLFVDRVVPFEQIALHGLVGYSFDYGNMSGNVKESFLKGIEYGAYPSFLVTYEQSDKLLESRSMRRFYSTNFKDWEKEIVEQYQQYNDALSDVQDQFITDHRMIADGVFETIYENGKRIFVNYNQDPFTIEGIEIGAEDFIVLEGGE
ncbi:DUF5696 domain-containing protein [Neobacillus vireti]|uniref:DUF5696 domain-containing protein n=1 Tax=Neobacillus vireti TaxID=220686 RepID=UPI002FFF19F7